MRDHFTSFKDCALPVPTPKRFLNPKVSFSVFFCHYSYIFSLCQCYLNLHSSTIVSFYEAVKLQILKCKNILKSFFCLDLRQIPIKPPFSLLISPINSINFEQALNFNFIPLTTFYRIYCTFHIKSISF